MTTRLDQLQQFLTDDPSDPFNHYALALEYQKTNVTEAIRIFENLIQEHPDYIPTYYHAGKLFQEQGEIEKAKAVFEQGIEMARKNNALKAMRELLAAKQELIDE